MKSRLDMVHDQEEAMKGQTSGWKSSLAGVAVTVWLLLVAIPAVGLGIGVDRSPVPPDCILNDGAGVEAYNWEIQFDSTTGSLRGDTPGSRRRSCLLHIP